MYSKRLLLTLGLLAFVVGLAVLTPVRFIVAVAPGLAAQVSGADGTLWAGQATISSAHGPLRVSWDSHSWRLLQLGLAFDWTLMASGASATGGLVVQPWGYVLDVTQGAIPGAWLASLLPEPGTTLDQPLLLRQIRLTGALNGRLRAVTGTLAWGPGTLRLANRPGPLQLPALRGTLKNITQTTDGDQIRLAVEAAPQPGKLIATATFDPSTRELEVVVLQRAADLVGGRAVAARPPDSVLVKMRQTLL